MTAAQHAQALYRAVLSHGGCTCGWRFAEVKGKQVKVGVKCQRCRVVEAFELSAFGPGMPQGAGVASEVGAR